MKENYNGYANYQTWLLKLYLDNDQYTQECYKEMVLQAYEESEKDKYETINCILNYIESELDEMQEESRLDGLMKDLLISAIEKIDLQEIAETYYSDFIEEA